MMRFHVLSFTCLGGGLCFRIFLSLSLSLSLSGMVGAIFCELFVGFLAMAFDIS